MAKQEGGGLSFHLLGPFEAWSGDTRLRLGGAIHERVLSSLLLETGRTVPVSRLVQVAWNDSPPATAAHQVRKAVADLRRRLPGGSDLIVTQGPGYRSTATTAELDFLEFGEHVHEAARAVADGRHSDGRAALRTALSLWRGRALSGSGSDLLESVAAGLEERRVAAAEQYFDLRLAEGEAAALVADLRDLIAQHPLREPLRGKLMLALYRSGRSAEALDEYRKVRELLVEELGIDPGAQLSGLYKAILREAPELGLDADESSAEPRRTPSETVPDRTHCTLPHDLPDFTGRRHELDVLLAAMTHRARSRGSRRIVALDGMGGSGKTSLAVHAAHQVAAEFPDGQLYIDLRGFTPGEMPVAPGAALHGLLRSLGVPGERIPEDLDGRAALWRAQLRGRRMLLLLDNAADAVQVLPLLPASSACLVVVTSRARLVDLDGAEWLSIGPMSLADGTLLVEQVLGAVRIGAEPDAGRELVRMCGQLPLALRIVAARLRNRPRWTLQYLVDRLQDETRRLGELSAGDRSVAATLQLSFQAMDEEHRTAFRLLALHPGTDVDVYAAAALLGLDVHATEATLERLLDVHLLQQPELGLYRFHDLVRDFARTLSCPATAREDHAAVRSLLGYYVTVTEAACGVLFPGRKASAAAIAPYDGALPPLGTMSGAAGWFDQEQDGLIAAVHLADREGLDREAACLTRNVVFRLNSLGRFNEFRDISRVAVAAARRADDLPLLGVSLSSLGVVCWKLGHLDEGVEAAQEGRDVAAELGDRRTESHAESTLGLLLTVLGRHTEALPRLERALDLERSLDAPQAEVESLSNLSTLYMQWGRYEEAAAAARQALEIHRTLDYRDNHVMVLTDLAFALTGLGAVEEAHEHLARARTLCDVSSPPADVALVLALSADIGERLGRHAVVKGLAERALALAGAGASPTRQAKTENLLGRLHLRRGDVGRALSLHLHAYEIAAAMPYRAEQAHALFGLAAVRTAMGDDKAAHQLRAQADELLRSMDVRVRSAAWCLSG